MHKGKRLTVPSGSCLASLVSAMNWPTLAKETLKIKIKLVPSSLKTNLKMSSSVITLLKNQAQKF